jgi:hypothetical protein
MTEDGRKQVRAIVGQGVAEAERLAELSRLRKPIEDPPVGGSRSGIEPGKWGLLSEDGEPMPDEMPDGCPVIPLGHKAGDLFMLDAAGQVVTATANQFGQGKVEQLFGDRIAYAYWGWPRFGKAPKTKDGKPIGPAKVDTFRTERVRQSLWGEAFRKGVFEQLEAVRGRGVWLGDNGELIIHCGDCLYVDGKVRAPGEVDGKIYPRMAPILHPWAGPVDGDAAELVLDLYNRFSWGRPKVDALLALGWDGVAMFSGAMRVRPSILVTGDKGRGKTTFQDIKRAIFGSYLLSTTNTTPAGIYQKVNQDARPIGIDELENSGDNTLAMRIVELARQSYSGGLMLRGGSNHNGVEFECRSSFLLSMINPPPLPPQDLSRLGILVLRRPPDKDRGPAPVLKDTDEIGAKFLRRMMDGWKDFDRIFLRYREALLLGGHEERGCDTYGTLLTCAHLLLGDDALRRFGYPVDDLSPWAKLLSVASMPELEDQGATWLRCLNMLFTRNIDMWRGGGQMTIGAVIESYESDAERSFSGVNNKLAQVGLRLVHPKEFKWPAGRKMPSGLVLAIPNTSPAVARIFEGTPWSAGPGGESGWRLPLKDAPDGVFLEGIDNRITINRTVTRCLLLDLAALDAVTGRKQGKAVVSDDVDEPMVADEMEAF